MKVWVLLLENVEDENTVELYSTQEKARTAFENYAAENKDKYGFEKYCDDCIAWFSSEYAFGSEDAPCYSYISMYEQKVL